ncbi:lipid-A-disaccharide synthase [Hwanghaeella grinnelliae]|uniref:Lipid-A-disaccharide synthase n=1 Tax=Hwanghaeella grinnelliae TaxID=2500179 RepID=A0A437QXT0_9PROT|nr:lipid-A-disaccharide synthase [Hwanghaeella grinnelliae]RVU39331.1 lipid-A-disaccharide synthase [Hwanghaeella grinnelliae]
MSTEASPVLFLVAGESSGDALGARLIRALRRLTGNRVEIHGIGGPLMEAEGLRSLFPMSELSVMGLLEVLPHARRIMGRMRQAAKAVDDLQPDAVITIDSPGFAHGFVTKIKTPGIRKIHYVAPTVWAWRAKRVHKFKRHFDHLLTLLPFEPPYFEAVGLKTTFVGHSVLESGLKEADGNVFRQAHGIGQDKTVIAVLPGSRFGEVSRHMAPFRAAIEGLMAKGRDFVCVLPTVPHLSDLVTELAADWPVPISIVIGEADRFGAMKAAQAAVAASGTVSLELALAETPAVIAYRMNSLTHWIVRRMVSIDHASLINIMAVMEGRDPPIPERLQRDCRGDLLAADLDALLGPEGERQLAALAPGLDALRPPDGVTPSEAAARAVLKDIA